MLQQGEIGIARKKNTIHLKREFFWNLNTFFFKGIRISNNQFMDLKKFALLDHEINKKQLTMMSSHLGQING